MKNSPTAPINAGLKVISDLEKEVAALNQQLTDATAELADKSANGNLSDEKVLERIARLQTFTTLLPARLTAREAAFDQAHKDLLAACHTFISKEANPRAGSVTRALRAKVKAELKAHFAEEYQLDQAVEKSTLVVECWNISFTLEENPMFGAVKYAHEQIAKWDRLMVLEAKL